MLLYICITTLLLLPYFHIRFKGKELKHRFGFVDIGFDSSIWIHAASVGEVNAIKPLLNKLLNKYPEKHFVLSTVTKTGRDIANKISPKLKTFFFPLETKNIFLPPGCKFYHETCI
jgi:3-deoxy-D-manno-octulosonic-acid transferase